MHPHRGYTLIFCLLVASGALAGQEKSDAATIRAMETRWTESYKQHSIDITMQPPSPLPETSAIARPTRPSGRSK